MIAPLATAIPAIEKGLSGSFLQNALPKGKLNFRGSFRCDLVLVHPNWENWISGVEMVGGPAHTPTFLVGLWRPC